MFQPENEMGVVALFCSRLHVSKWEIVSIGMPFPDAVIRKDGVNWSIEFEYLASNFISHGHDYRACELIVCWENDLKDCPLPVLALSEPDWEKRKPVKGNPLASEVEFWKNRAGKLEKEIRKLKPDKKPKLSPGERPRREDVLQKMIVHYREDPYISHREMSDLVGVSKSTISNYLDELGQKKIVHVNGNGVEIIGSL